MRPLTYERYRIFCYKKWRDNFYLRWYLKKHPLEYFESLIKSIWDLFQEVIVSEINDPARLSRKEQDKYDLDMMFRFGRISKEEYKRKLEEIDKCE